MSANKQPVHLRLPQRSSLARGTKNESGEITGKPDARVASEDPALKSNTAGKPKRGAAKPVPRTR
jgi:hypothetical protein